MEKLFLIMFSFTVLEGCKSLSSETKSVITNKNQNANLITLGLGSKQDQVQIYSCIDGSLENAIKRSKHPEAMKNCRHNQILDTPVETFTTQLSDLFLAFLKGHDYGDALRKEYNKPTSYPAELTDLEEFIRKDQIDLSILSKFDNQSHIRETRNSIQAEVGDDSNFDDFGSEKKIDSDPNSKNFSLADWLEKYFRADLLFIRQFHRYVMEDKIDPELENYIVTKINSEKKKVRNRLNDNEKKFLELKAIRAEMLNDKGLYYLLANRMRSYRDKPRDLIELEIRRSLVTPVVIESTDIFDTSDEVSLAFLIANYFMSIEFESLEVACEVVHDGDNFYNRESTLSFKINLSSSDPVNLEAPTEDLLTKCLVAFRNQKDSSGEKMRKLGRKPIREKSNAKYSPAQLERVFIKKYRLIGKPHEALMGQVFRNLKVAHEGSVSPGQAIEDVR